MPIKIPNALPATQTLLGENIFVITETRAITQDIRPLKIAILNLMPTKIVTETQLSRLLGNTPLQVELELMQMRGRVSKNTSSEHMLKFYTTFDKVCHKYYDGMIITGAPVEKLEFKDVLKHFNLSSSVVKKIFRQQMDPRRLVVFCRLNVAPQLCDFLYAVADGRI